MLLHGEIRRTPGQPLLIINLHISPAFQRWKARFIYPITNASQLPALEGSSSTYDITSKDDCVSNEHSKSRAVPSVTGISDISESKEMEVPSSFVRPASGLDSEHALYGSISSICETRVTLEQYLKAKATFIKKPGSHEELEPDRDHVPRRALDPKE
jgi:hypothetical protein